VTKKSSDFKAGVKIKSTPSNTKKGGSKRGKKGDDDDDFDAADEEGEEGDGGKSGSLWERR